MATPANLAEDLAAWAGGFGQHGATPMAFLPFCRDPQVGDVLRFLVDNVRPRGEVDAVRSNIRIHGSAAGNGPSGADGGSGGGPPTPELIARKEASALEVQRLRAREGELKERARHARQGMLAAEAARGAARAQAREAGFQEAALEAYQLRCEGSERLLQEFHKRLERMLDKAKRSQAGQAAPTCAQGPDDEDPPLPTTQEAVRSACAMVEEALMEHIAEANPAFAGKADLTSGTGDVGSFKSFPTPAQAASCAEAEAAAPAAFLHALAAATAEAAAAVKAETDSIDLDKDAATLHLGPAPPAAGSGAGAGAGSGARDANALLRERQAAHVDKFTSTEAALNEADRLQRAFEMKRGDLEAAAVAVELAGGAAAAETRALNQLQLDLAGAEAAAEVYQEEISRLAASREDRVRVEQGLRRKWGLIQSFDARSQALDRLATALIQANMEAVGRWAAEAGAARKFVERAVGPVARELGERAAAAEGAVEHEAMSFLKVPPRIAGLGGRARVSPSGDVGTLPVLSRLQAAAEGGAGQLPSDAQLAAVLRAAEDILPCPLSVAPERALAALAEARRAGEDLIDLAGAARGSLRGAEGAAAKEEAAAARLAARRAAAEEAAVEETVPQLEKNTQLAVTCTAAVPGVKAALREWWEQPAATALPWEQVEGRNVGEWVQEIRRLQV